MKIKITRSYSAKRQLRQYEPIDSFCAAEIEVDLEPAEFQSQRASIAEDLDVFVRAEVRKTIDSILPQFREDPEIVRGNELLQDLKNPLLSEADRKSLKRIHSAKSERQKMFFAKDEAQKNSFDYDNKDYHSATEIHGAIEEHQKTFDPANEAILAERNE